ncbi:MAG: hypothetical protein ABSA53_10765 [Streptosporangiaceae bacterium]|jgi:predicted RNA-binding Zn-ribbon protein involved in translation (DUF1610 family)
MNPLIGGLPGSGKNGGLPSIGAGFRVIYHEPICPECGSFDIDRDQVDTGDGLAETAHICGDCGTAWPLACVTDWSTVP